MKRVIIVGGGAAGFFAALSCAKHHPDYKVTILEKSQKLLAKVKVSGGGRCNVTHACFDASYLVKFYPRGEKQLRGPFTRFNPKHTIDWFAERDVKLKQEPDGRMFPVTDSSQTIIDCFLKEAQLLHIQIKTGIGLDKLSKENNSWKVHTSDKQILEADAVIISTGGALQVWKALMNLGLCIVPAVPSLFTFNIRDSRLQNLQGISVENVSVAMNEKRGIQINGPLLITHWGLSGPGVLKLSAWEARKLAAANYNFEIVVNWTGTLTKHQVSEEIKSYKNKYSRHQVGKHPLFNISSRLWNVLVEVPHLNYADLSREQIERISESLSHSVFKVHGKSTFKEEFVTAGGVDLSEIDFKTMQSKRFPGLYFAGEVLDIDAITGGFNFQAAWTTGYIAGSSV